MLIAFVHNKKAFLPDLQQYIHFFSKYNIRCATCTKKELNVLKPDVEWHFMGIDWSQKKATIKIHEYLSASSPPFAALKNRLKVKLNNTPDYRLFLNQYVYDSFPFNDNISYGFRDMGVNTADLMEDQPVGKKYDFIYSGEMRSRRLNRLIKCFTNGPLSTKTILFLSKDYSYVAESLKKYRNILFEGPVPYREVSQYIRASRFGINYIPDVSPYNEQTSTKFLEYAANKIPIISSRYPWIEKFQARFGGKYFYLDHDLSNFTWDAVNNSDYSSPDLRQWTWELQIRKSGVLEFLSSSIPGLRW